MRINEQEIREMLRKAIKDAGTLSEFARKTGISKQHISHVANAIRKPSPAILTVLGLRRREIKEVIYERI